MIRDELNATYALLSDWMAARVEESPELEHGGVLLDAAPLLSGDES